MNDFEYLLAHPPGGRPRYYRLDGSPYPMNLEGFLEWGRDLEDGRGRIIRHERLWNGVFLSTVWLGFNHSWGEGPPLIFESMAFDELGHSDELYCDRYSTLAEAEAGHEFMRREMSGILSTLRRWWRQATRED